MYITQFIGPYNSVRKLNLPEFEDDNHPIIGGMVNTTKGKFFMPAFTYLSDSEKEEYSKIEDKDLRELVEEVKNKVNVTYYVSKKIYLHNRLFRKPKEEVIYYLYADMVHEVQCINIGGRLEDLMTYFYGIVNGIHYQYQWHKTNGPKTIIEKIAKAQEQTTFCNVCGAHT